MTLDAKPPSKIRSAEDGWLDMSGFLDQAYGFVPLVVPITEPAVGFGAAGGVAFIDKPMSAAADGFGRPNITALGGVATDNGTWGLAAADIRRWMDDRLQTQVGLVYASVNLDYFGDGKNDRLAHDPLTYHLEPVGGGVGAKYRMGSSNFWLGAMYAIATTEVSFDSDSSPFLPDFTSTSRVGGVIPSFTFDNRDNMFTPTRGTYVEATVGVFSEALGGDSEFQRAGIIAMQFVPITSTLTLGVRADATFSFGDTPFYMLPYIGLRGAPVMRYQGEDAADIEAEIRWQFWKRFSVVGFAGAGAAWTDLERFENEKNVATGGFGFRYELARKYGIHMGVDIAFGPDVTAFYVQFGSAWARP